MKIYDLIKTLHMLGWKTEVKVQAKGHKAWPLSLLAQNHDVAFKLVINLKDILLWCGRENTLGD